MNSQELYWLLLAALLIALLGALRWDLLGLWWNALFAPRDPVGPSPASEVQPAPRQEVPRRLHEARLLQQQQHQPLPQRPQFHRSGRRG